MQKQHAFGYLLGYVHLIGPVNGYFGLMQKLKEGATMTKLTNNKHLLRARPLRHPHHRRQMRMRSYLHTRHNLPLKLLHQRRIGQLNLLNGDFLPPPTAKKHLGAGARTHRIAKLQLAQVYDELVGAFGDFGCDELADVVARGEGLGDCGWGVGGDPHRGEAVDLELFAGFVGQGLWRLGWRLWEIKGLGIRGEA